MYHKRKPPSRPPRPILTPQERTPAPEPVVPQDHSASSLQPHEVIALQRQIGNQAVVQQLRPPGAIQRDLDEELVRDIINEQASGVKKFDAGLTDGAYKVNTTSREYPSLVVKATDKQMPIFDAHLAKALGINTPDIVSLPNSEIIRKLGELDEGLGRKLGRNKSSTIQEFIKGQTLDQRPMITGKSLKQIGNIAAFDMMIGKVDLFDNYDARERDYEYNAQNFKNIIFTESGDAYDIDLDDGVRGRVMEHQLILTSEDTFQTIRKTPPEIIIDILKKPTELSPYVKSHIAIMLKQGAGVDLYDRSYRGKHPELEINGLIVQRGILETVQRTGDNEQLEKVLRNKPEGKGFESIEEMTRFYQKVSPSCAEAIEAIDKKIHNLQEDARRRRIEEQEQEEERRRLAQARNRDVGRNKQGKRGKKGKGCFLTTACVTYKGLPDSCEELTLLRAFRDGYMSALPEGPALIEGYYALAPQVVQRIWEDEESLLVLEGLYQVVRQCVAWIQGGEPERAMDAYSQQLFYLKQRYQL